MSSYCGVILNICLTTLLAPQLVLVLERSLILVVRPKRFIVTCNLCLILTLYQLVLRYGSSYALAVLAEALMPVDSSIRLSLHQLTCNTRRHRPSPACCFEIKSCASRRRGERAFNTSTNVIWRESATTPKHWNKRTRTRERTHTVHIPAHKLVRTHTHIHTYVHRCTHMHTHIYTHTKTPIRRYTHVDARSPALTRAHTHAHTHWHTHTHTHTHTKKNTHAYKHTNRHTHRRAQTNTYTHTRTNAYTQITLSKYKLFQRVTTYKRMITSRPTHIQAYDNE